MKQQVIKTLKSKFLLIPGIVISILSIGVVVYFSNIQDTIIFPDQKNYRVGYYTDEPNGGNSQILDHVLSDSLIKISFQLKDKFQSPYVGLSITPINKTPIDAGKYNRINIAIMGQNMERVGVSLSTLPLYSNEKNEMDESLFHYYLNISPKKKTYIIPIAKFQHPDWWNDLHLITENNKEKPDLKNILHLNIGSAFSPQIDNIKTIEIERIGFTRDNHQLFASLAISYITFILLNFFLVYSFRIRKSQNSNITVTYKSLENIETVPYDERCIRYINSNYSKNDLTLEKISKETAITQRRITKIIHDGFECNFKTYLNRIRINESKRFLTQSDLNMGEIAYKVGFNSQSHFNRVFKSEMNISPSEYRESHKF